MSELTHPGQVLLENFMNPRKLSQNALARAIDVPPRRINEIILGKRKITADTDLRLCKFFALKSGFWLQYQITTDLKLREGLISAALERLPASVDSATVTGTSFYSRLAERRKDDLRLRGCIEEVVEKLVSCQTSEERPGMLLGRIQSGKTRAFIGVTAKAFDRGYDVAVILTKGTKTLAAQTVARLNADFAGEIDGDEVLVFDIMKPPGRLIRGDLKKKLIIVAKKQVDNLERLNRLFDTDYPSLAKANVLLVDDEADLASLRFVRKAGEEIEQGKIAERLDEFRGIVKSTSFLQVTATPYSLYLQPEKYTDANNNPIYKPMKPAFTVLLPMHSGYVGGDTYFGARDPGSVESYLFVPVTSDEQAALRTPDERKIKSANVLSTPNTAGLRRAVVAFVLAACVRQWQQRANDERRTKYAMVIHNDTQKAAHEWQHSVVEWIVQAINEAIEGNSTALEKVFKQAYDDLHKSVIASDGRMPDYESAYEMFTEAFQGDEVMRETVNSDKDVLALLDDNAELRLRTSFNIFIGGSILDRGITIPNLIAFYYGRSPQRTQADTVLQHSRMYGNRPRADVAVSRLYASTAVYDRMCTINSFETALREAFETGSHDKGVVFIRTDSTGQVRSCSPDKLLLSEIVAVRSGGLYLPTGFETENAKTLGVADRNLKKLIPKVPKKGTSVEITLDTAIKMLYILQETLVVSDNAFDWDAMKALLQFYSSKVDNKIDLFVETGRRLDRLLSGDKSGLSVIGTSLRDTLRNASRQKPALVLLQQEGTVELHWSGHPFWWPILAAPPNVEPCVFATKVAS